MNMTFCSSKGAHINRFYRSNNITVLLYHHYDAQIKNLRIKNLSMGTCRFCIREFVQCLTALLRKINWKDD